MSTFRKLPALALMLVLVGGIGVFLFMGNGHTDPAVSEGDENVEVSGGVVGDVSVANELYDASTIALLGIEAPHDIAAQVLTFAEKIVKILPDELRQQLNIPTSEERKVIMGFDPVTADAWRSIGIDPEGGLYLSFDSSVGLEPSPIFLIQITDRDTLLKTLSSLGLEVGVFQGPGEVERIIVNRNYEFLLGKKGPYTALVPLPDDQDAKTRRLVQRDFEVFLKAPHQKLADNVAVQKILSDGAGGRRIFGLFNTKGADALEALGTFPDDPLAYFFRQRIRAFGAVAHDTGGVLSLVGDQETQRALKKMFNVETATNLVKFIPESGWMAARLSLNLDTLFLGASELIPPSMAEKRLAVANTANELTKAGLPFDLVREALDGQILLGVDISSFTETVISKNDEPNDVVAFLAFGVKNTRAADELLASVVNVTSESFGERPRSVSLDGYRGWQVGDGPDHAHVVRVENTIFLAMNAPSIEGAIRTSKGSNLASTEAGSFLMAQEQIFGMSVSLNDILLSSVSTMPKSSPHVTSAMAAFVNSDDHQQRLNFAATLDEGLRFEFTGSDPTMLSGPALLGLMAAASIPLLMNQLEQGKTKTTEIKMNEIKKAINIYQATNKDLPRDLSVLTNPETGRPFLKDIEDDFGTEVRYEIHSRRGFTLISAGPDGQFGGDDDIHVTDP